MRGISPKQSSIAEEAAGWFIRLECGAVSPEEQALFVDWLRESPIHVQEFLLAAITYLTLDAVFDESRVCLDELLNRAVPEIVPLFGSACRDSD